MDTENLAAHRVEVAPYGTEGGLGSWLKPHYAVMTADTHQHGATLTADGTLLVVGTGPIVPTDDDGPSLTIRSREGEERVVPLDGPHEDVVASRDGRTACVTGGFTRDGYWNGITIVDLPSGDTRRLTVGTRPLGIATL